MHLDSSNDSVEMNITSNSTFSETSMKSQSFMMSIDEKCVKEVNESSMMSIDAKCIKEDIQLWKWIKERVQRNWYKKVKNWRWWQWNRRKCEKKNKDWKELANIKKQQAKKMMMIRN